VLTGNASVTQAPPSPPLMLLLLLRLPSTVRSFAVLDSDRLRALLFGNVDVCTQNSVSTSLPPIDSTTAVGIAPCGDARSVGKRTERTRRRGAVPLLLRRV
jgi:hypothetical protein